MQRNKVRLFDLGFQNNHCVKHNIYIPKAKLLANTLYF